MASGHLRQCDGSPCCPWRQWRRWWLGTPDPVSPWPDPRGASSGRGQRQGWRGTDRIGEHRQQPAVPAGSDDNGGDSALAAARSGGVAAAPRGEESPRRPATSRRPWPRLCSLRWKSFFELDCCGLWHLICITPTFRLSADY